MLSISLLRADRTQPESIPCVRPSMPMTFIPANVNMSEFASGDAMTSLGGPTYSPHNPVRSPSGSSGGTGWGYRSGWSSYSFTSKVLDK